MDVSSVRVLGPWVLLKVFPPEYKQGDLFLPQDNTDEKIGHAKGKILKLGEGFPSTKKEMSRTGKKYQDNHGLSVGDVVLFRRYLKGAAFFDDDLCFIHINDIAAVSSGRVTDETGVRD